MAAERTDGASPERSAKRFNNIPARKDGSVTLLSVVEGLDQAGT
jgi:hypothetical protein